MGSDARDSDEVERHAALVEARVLLRPVRGNLAGPSVSALRRNDMGGDSELRFSPKTGAPVILRAINRFPASRSGVYAWSV